MNEQTVSKEKMEPCGHKEPLRMNEQTVSIWGTNHSETTLEKPTPPLYFSTVEQLSNDPICHPNTSLQERTKKRINKSKNLRKNMHLSELNQGEKRKEPIHLQRKHTPPKSIEPLRPKRPKRVERREENSTCKKTPRQLTLNRQKEPKHPFFRRQASISRWKTKKGKPEQEKDTQRHNKISRTFVLWNRTLIYPPFGYGRKEPFAEEKSENRMNTERLNPKEKKTTSASRVFHFQKKGNTCEEKEQKEWQEQERFLSPKNHPFPDKKPPLGNQAPCGNKAIACREKRTRFYTPEHFDLKSKSNPLYPPEKHRYEPEDRHVNPLNTPPKTRVNVPA